MFETDFDQELLQIDLPETNAIVSKHLNNGLHLQNLCNIKNGDNLSNLKNDKENFTSPLPENKQKISDSNKSTLSHSSKRKIIDTFFDQESKRKFPGPAGLLTGTIEDNKNNQICHMEILSQDIDFSENHINTQLFQSPLWKRLEQDVDNWNLSKIDSIKVIKQQALAGNLLSKKAEVIIAFIETIDRSASDPLVVLRDISGQIKCTLHRDAWSAFSSYIVSKYCALVLLKPTVLTTGSAFKKHYLNITLGNIAAIYSSALFNDETDENIPKGYKKVVTDDFTVIQLEDFRGKGNPNTSNNFNATNYIEDLDASLFLEEIYE